MKKGPSAIIAGAGPAGLTSAMEFLKQTDHRLYDFVTPEYAIALFLFFYSSPLLPFCTFVSAF